MSVLEQIVERTRERLLVEEKPDRRRAEEIAEGRVPFAFAAALRSRVGSLAPHPFPLSPASRGEGDTLQGAGQELLVSPGDMRQRAGQELLVSPSPRLRGEGTGVRGQTPTNPRIIAEIKAASPSAGPIAPDPEIEGIARAYERGGASAISIVTEPEFFGGSREWIARAKAAAGLPIVMKDFIVEPSQIVRGIAAGADGMLLLASLLEIAKLRDFIALLEAYGCDALVEVHDERELEKAIAAGARMIGVNNRDLSDFHVDLATSERLAKAIPAEIIRVAESGIRERADVERLGIAGFDAVLVGESLLRQSDRSEAVRRLLG